MVQNNLKVGHLLKLANVCYFETAISANIAYMLN